MNKTSYYVPRPYVRRPRPEPIAYYWSTGWIAVAFLAGAALATLIAVLLMQP